MYHQKADAALLLRPRAGDVAFRDLDRDEIEKMLLRNCVGRLAFALHDRVDVQPIHYVYDRGWIYGRTSDGNKMGTVQHNQWVAFEVDEIDALFDWKSLVVHGTLWILYPRGSPRAAELWNQASELMTRIIPDAMTEEDPVGFRKTLFRIAVGDVRGRQAMTRKPEKLIP